jgi:hypothetical protein
MRRAKRVIRICRVTEQKRTVLLRDEATAYDATLLAELQAAIEKAITSCRKRNAWRSCYDDTKS